MYRTLFGEAHPITYNFAESTAYYAAHERLMKLSGGGVSLSPAA